MLDSCIIIDKKAYRLIMIMSIMKYARSARRILRVFYGEPPYVLYFPYDFLLTKAELLPILDYWEIPYRVAESPEEFFEAEDLFDREP